MTCQPEKINVACPQCSTEISTTEESIMPVELHETLQRQCSSVEWRKTTTYPLHLEHEYILRKNHPEIIAALSKAIDDHGHDESFYSQTYRYMILDGYRYWHFDTLVNRETTEKYLSRHQTQRDVL